MPSDEPTDMVAERTRPSDSPPGEEEAGQLRERLKQTQPFESPAQEAMLSLLVAGAAVEQEIERVCAGYGLAASHYNALRILAGGPAEGYARSDIIDRMIDRGPDVTRLMDRLEAQELASRRRSEYDRRVTLHRITDEGRTLLDEMHADICALQRRFARRLSEEDQRTLADLCASVYPQDAGR